MVECDVAVIDDLDIAVEGELAADAKDICPDFTEPCPRAVVTNFTGYGPIGAVFWVSFNTDLPIDCRFRQRQIVGGTPGAWSGTLTFSAAGGGTPHTGVYETAHTRFDHQFSNKAASSLWDYQLIFNFEDTSIGPEFYPDCGNATIRVQYPNKGGSGGGYDPEFPIPEG